jgi:ubiquinone/menaquinone biosynthesis C-methylase UbiE
MTNSRVDYERLAADYARHRTIHPGVLRALIERGEVSSSSRVLEVGCGTGNYLIALREATGCAATGIDPSEAMLATAKSRSDAIAWAIGPGEAIPLPDGSVDLLYNVDVIHHVGDRSAFFREAMRVLTQGGRICTATDSAEDIARRRPLSSHFPETVAVELARYPAIASLRAEMSAAGLVELEPGHVELRYALDDIARYRNRAYSSLHLISDDAHRAGIARLDAELAEGTVDALSLYTLVWGERPVAG